MITYMCACVCVCIYIYICIHTMSKHIYIYIYSVEPHRLLASRTEERAARKPVRCFYSEGHLTIQSIVAAYKPLYNYDFQNRTNVSGEEEKEVTVSLRARKEASPAPEGPLSKLGENYSSVGRDCCRCSPDFGEPSDLVSLSPHRARIRGRRGSPARESSAPAPR